MIYEIDIIDFFWPVPVLFLSILFVSGRLIWTSEAVSKKFKFKALGALFFLLGLPSLWLLSSHVYANIKYLLNDYDIASGAFIASREDERYEKILLKGSSIRYGKRKGRCFTGQLNLVKGTHLEIKYIGSSNDACILSIQEIKELDSSDEDV
ncbi:hypothetical protein PSECIP111854_03065 [Pseudoalteromonas sp. CIP111854]|uniref:Uncharacterized protein n=1 Tax=Pseudoalteromonas holothuriae TaxID=2963714 RepID=A0A9W4R1M4_9GAMM|nr:hypothetical protein [Pseudoalteromonas sp. CIP111854]CAH9062687.1 hypothetical protein PSECIP111854_03065 [Pseudoalteromonas sp. CIP111854]